MILVISIKYQSGLSSHDNMMKNHNFYGSTTVGERGQIVLPAKLRDDLGINAGDKLLVLSNGPPGKEGIMIMKAEVLNDMVAMMNQHLQSIMDMANEESESE